MTTMALTLKNKGHIIGNASYVNSNKIGVINNVDKNIISTAVEYEKKGFFGLFVESIKEAIRLRREKIVLPLIVSRPCDDQEIETLILHDLIPLIHNKEYANKINDVAKEYGKIQKVQVKLDRFDSSTFAYMDYLKTLSNLRIEGIFFVYEGHEVDETALSSLAGFVTTKHGTVFYVMLPESNSVYILPSTLIK